ncbi:uncharacterized protein LOC113343205 isoform X1 [Papaver somniferum]|uniref:uncharacterized protein LOC113343205 isoform X1 n=1 Tax=Papaver somniferum TaxID=3469 RepID=UPI000E6F7605|nr:uncharacterized protein LOC113343205 isoform X1 [Papaver somniferum]
MKVSLNQNNVKFLINQPTSLMIRALLNLRTLHKRLWVWVLIFTKLHCLVLFKRKWGWSEAQIQNAFMLHPQCMKHFEKKISMTMDYLVNQMGIARCPMILHYSLEKTFIPRLAVNRILTAKVLIKDIIFLQTILHVGKESFLGKFVSKYEQEAPEVLKNSHKKLLADVDVTAQLYKDFSGKAHHIMEPHALLASTYTLWRKEIHPTLAARNQKLLKKQCCATQVRMKEIGIPIASNAIFAIRK